MKDKSPCDGCVPPERQPGCQDRCEKGIAFRAQQQEENERIRQIRDKERDHNYYKGERVFATKKRYKML